MPHESTGIDKTSLNILQLKPWIPLEEAFRTVSSGKHAEYVLHRKPPPPDDRFATKNLGVCGNSFQKSFFVHHVISLVTNRKGKNTPT